MSELLFYIESSVERELKIKRSRFICRLVPALTIQEAKQVITETAKQHKQANHNCWAYIIGKQGETFHSSDAGEPAGTAGKPMLNVIQRYKLTNIAAVVTRYFGGVKLGVRGLIDAYGESVDVAVQKAKLIPLIARGYFVLETDYANHAPLTYKLEQLGCLKTDESFTATVETTWEVPMSEAEAVWFFIEAQTAAGHLKIKKPILERMG
ncbi:MAG: YigZ family protein [Candidatus Cloacimonetes bacterium]|nr:YigZ family protein [Candidatus Cloacimonadota bacterium]